MGKELPSQTTFEEAYKGSAPWDIDGPQEHFVQIKDQVKGSILDAGCGTGENSLFFANCGNDVTGIDYLEEPIKRAKEKAASRKAKAHFEVLDALNLSLLDKQFDNVIDCGLFHVFSNEARVTYISELGKILRSGGSLYLLCFSDEEPGEQGPRRISKDEIKASFSSGWIVDSIKPTRFKVRKDAEKHFSKGGPLAWFCQIRRA